MPYSYIDGSKSLIIVPMDRTSITLEVAVDHPNYEKIKEGIKNDIPTDDMIGLCSPVKQIQAALDAHSDDYHGVEIVDGVLLYEEKPVINSLADRILKAHAEGFALEPLAFFAESLFKNPTPTVLNELDLWIEASDLPLTPDGAFLAYKKVRADYTDIHSGTFDNSVGRTPSMPREEVNANRDVLCSTGLHFCSKSYLPHFGNSPGSRVMIVKVFPEHVVSIPSDYKNAKGRASQYTVVDEISQDQALDKKWAAIAPEYGAPQTAKIIETATVKDEIKSAAAKAPKSVSIQTKELGDLNERYFANAIAKHGSQAAWARSHGWPVSTVKGWKQRLLAAGAKL